MIVAFDDNLGLPDDVAPAIGAELASYHELADMLADFESGAVHAMFAPAGSLPYLTTEPAVVAQATRGPERTHRLHSTYVVPVATPAPDFDTVAASRLGRVNRYCTTSFWAPMISLIDERGVADDAPHESIAFVDCAGFVDMFQSVLDGRSDGAMVWDAVLAAHPDLSAGVQRVFTSEDLAAPVIVANATLATDERDRMASTLAAFESRDDRGFFNGFSTPDRRLIATFEHQMATARTHFDV